MEKSMIKVAVSPFHRVRSWSCLVLGAGALTLTGCGSSLEDLVRVNRPKVGTIIPFEGQAAVKISPGNTIATSTDVAMSAHVTITDRPLSGGDVSAKVSMGRHRNSNQ